MNQAKAQIIIPLSTTSIELVYVEGGVFQMGGDEYERERPIHEVTVPSFYMSKLLVSQQLYQSILGENPSRVRGAKRPVETVSWEDAKAFITKLNSLQEIQSQLGVFRLPTESEWEYAARGGKYSEGYKYCGSDDLKQVGWYRENSGMETKPIGLLQSNELGLYDMNGNVDEYCEDDYHGSYKNAPDDGNAWVDEPSRGANRVVRGGYCFSLPVYCRPAFRDGSSPGNRDDITGFRLVFSPVTGKSIRQPMSKNRQEKKERL